MTKAHEIVSFAFRHPDTGKVNEKQCYFHDEVMRAVARLTPKRYFAYGGAIRGGKTFVCLFILVKLARMFPRSRWHVLRGSFTELEDTTIPSMEKLIGLQGPDFVWKRNKNNYHVRFANGSKIFFKSEKLGEDPELGWMLGLETNGILLEQIEGLSQKLLERAKERLGSWYINPMPVPLLLMTFNPTDTWVKKEIYDKQRAGTLGPEWLYVEALPDHNPYVTDDQWRNWDNLDPISRANMVEGIWRFLTDAKTFAYAFDAKRTVVNVETPEGRLLMTPKKSLPLKIIFDFNVDPITALVGQNDGMRWGKIYKEYRLRNSDIFELCTRIKTDWQDYYLIASGDASGRARNAITRGNRTAIKTIAKLLRLGPRQLQFPKANPSVRNTRILLNALLHNHPAFWISSECQYFIDDLETVKVNDKGEIDKTKDARKTHLLDNGRYFAWNNFRNFVQF